jgi:hypothetical protein
MRFAVPDSRPKGGVTLKLDVSLQRGCLFSPQSEAVMFARSNLGSLLECGVSSSRTNAAGMCQKHASLKNGTALISAAYKQLSSKIV